MDNSVDNSIKSNKKIVFTGGGTAGHVMPNLALMAKMDSRHELIYIGCPDSVEERLVKEKMPTATFYGIAASKMVRGKILQNLLLPFRLLRSRAKAKKLLKELQPDLIFSKGGFVALPVCLAAKKNVPIMLHESDFSFGLANKLALKKCNTICTSFADLAHSTNKGIHTGSPLRQEIYTGNRANAEKITGLKFSSTHKNLLIIGGSSGATAINDAVFDNLETLTSKYNVIHITGKNCDKKETRQNYFSCEFTANIADLFAAADLCITRGGANALFELIALKIPSLVIPLPKGISRGDQVLNAEYFKKLNCVEVLEQETLQNDKKALKQALESLEKNATMLKQNMANQKNIDGTGKILKLIKSYLS